MDICEHLHPDRNKRTDITGTSPYTAGTLVSITANPASAGMVFDKWTTNNGGTFADVRSANTTFTVPAGNVAVTANYTPTPTYTVHYEPNGGTGTMPDSAPINRGDPYTIAANLFSRSSYSFAGWNTTANGTGISYAAGATIPSEIHFATFIFSILISANSTSNQHPNATLLSRTKSFHLAVPAVVREVP